MLPSMLRDRTVIPRTTPRHAIVRYPGISNVVVTSDDRSHANLNQIVNRG